MIDDLETFIPVLRTWLDEDEQAAQAAIQGRWAASWITDREDYTFWSVHTATSDSVGATEVAGAGFDGTGGIHTEADAEHIARHDPARVLAEAAAKRRIIAAYETAQAELAAAALKPGSTSPAEMGVLLGKTLGLGDAIRSIASAYSGQTEQAHDAGDGR